MDTKSCRTGLILGTLAIFLSICDLMCVQGCEYWEWRCKNGDCITRKSHCNGEYECRDKSDEDDCPTEHPISTYAPGCPDGMFQCHNKKCYYIEWHCDGTKDCTDGTDERGCPGFGDGLMPTSSIIGMSVTVGGLFLLLIGIIVMITCIRRKNGRRPYFRRRRDINEVIYPGSRLPSGAIACPTISGEIVMREPPPRYTSQPDIYTSRPAAAAVNLAFSPDEPLSRPPPCYTSHPNLVNDLSNLSVCSSVEPPPSYTSQQDQNVLDTTIIEGAINLSFCPDDGDSCLPDQSATQTSNNTMDSSYYSIHSMKSWADNLDVETLSLGSQIDEREIPTIADARQSTNRPFNYKPSTQSQRNLSSGSANRFQKSQMPACPKMGYTSAAKMYSRIHRAKALGRQYSSTPALAENNYPSTYDRRVSLETSDAEIGNSMVFAHGKFPKCTSVPYNNCVERRVKSAVQLNQRHDPESKSSFQKESNKAESTTCCNSHQNIVKSNSGSQGLKFWRNNNASMSKACVSRCKSEASIPEMQESDEGFQEDTELRVPAEKSPSGYYPNTQHSKPLVYTIPKVSSQRASNSLSQLYLTDMNSVGSNSSINSWVC